LLANAQKYSLIPSRKEEDVAAMSISPNEDVVAVSAGNKVRIWHISKNSLLRTLFLAKECVNLAWNKADNWQLAIATTRSPKALSVYSFDSTYHGNFEIENVTTEFASIVKVEWQGPLLVAYANGCIECFTDYKAGQYFNYQFQNYESELLQDELTSDKLINVYH
jgi:WD40 repeat protein